MSQGEAFFRVRIDESDPRLVWWEVPKHGIVYDLVWADGYTVQFEPDPIVLRPDGSVLFRDNEWVTKSYGICVLGDGRFYFRE
jgi:hypothetical protein